jgi:multidrug efflux pump subunit AcrB
VVQSLDYPTLDVRIDREKSGLAGATMEEVSRSVLAATSSSRFVVPSYWPDPKTGIGYQVQVEIPQPQMRSIQDLAMIPVLQNRDHAVLLRDVASLSESVMPGEFDRYNMKRELSITANFVGVDLGEVSERVAKSMAIVKKVDDAQKDKIDQEIVSKGGTKAGRITYELRGQIPPLQQMMSGLGLGLLLAILAIFFLLTAHFQSFRLAIVSLAAVPAVILGVIGTLMATATTINIQSFIGMIMALGVAMANAILLISFAEQRRLDGQSAMDAASSAAIERRRPILMTTFAMLAGMLPMAVGWGDSGAQTAPLGRAVMGGLVAATFTTLFVLPAMFAWFQSRAGRRNRSLHPMDGTWNSFPSLEDSGT